MVCFKGLWRGHWAAATTASLALVALGCGGSKDTITVSGKVTYTRRPLTKDASGVPQGLSSSYGSAQIARGVKVRAIEADVQDLDDGTTQTAYIIAGSTFTDEYGKYSLSVPKDTACFIELQSIAGTSSTNALRIVADESADLTNISATDSVDSPLYSLRKALDGTSDTTDPVHATQNGSSVNFDVTDSTRWWLAPNPMELVKSATLESSATGSRVLGIADSIYTFIDVYGDPTPGGTLDLFYRPTKNDDSRGSFVDYTDASRYYGSLRAKTNDDAWDESIIFMLCARNALYSHTTVTPYTPPSDQLPFDTTGLARKTGLEPVHALIDGLPYGMAASLLQSPYLADTTDSAITVRDIRSVDTLEKSAYSAPSIAALSWDLLIKANKLTDTYASWSSIDTESLRRFFTLKVPTDSNSYPSDTASVYYQLKRLEEGQSSSDTVDLDNIFTDDVLTAMVQSYGLDWPRPATLDSFLQDWTTDPEGNMPTLHLNMDSAHLDATGVFPNLSKGEIAHARFLLTKDVLYTLTLSASELPTGASLELKIIDSSAQYQTITLSGTTSLSQDLMMDGNADTLKYIPVHIRLKTDSTVTTAIDPITVTVNLAVKAS